MEFEVLDGLKIYYETYGTRSDIPVVLIHGAGVDHNMWIWQISRLPQEGYFLIAPDMRGHGESSPSDEFRIRDCAADIEKLLSHLNIERAIFIGVSMGGLIAQRFTCDYQDKVIALIISDSYSEVSSFREKISGWMAYLTMKISMGLFIKSLKSIYEGSVLQYFIDRISSMTKRHLLSIRAELNRFKIIEELGKIEVPALVIAGNGMGEFPIRMAEKTADAIMNARLEIIEGSYDPSNMIKPVEFSKLVIDFIDSLNHHDYATRVEW